MITRWKKSRTSVYNIGYHLIWCPKYRRRVLVNGIDNRLKEILYSIATEIDVVIENIEVMPEHVHLFVKSTPIMSPAGIISQMKGKSSRILREEFPELKKRLPTLWTRSYYVESVGHISEETIKKYIEDQKRN